MKKILLIILLITTSCKITQKNIEVNYYSIVNKRLLDASKSRDSVFVFLPYTIEDSKKYKEHREVYRLSKLKSFEKKLLSEILTFFKSNGIDFEKEEPYFKRQLNIPINFDQKKIIIKKINFFSRKMNLKEQIKYNRHNENYKNYSFDMSRPVFTKNGKKAILHHYDGKGNFLFIVLDKKKNQWVEKDKFYYARS